VRIVGANHFHLVAAVVDPRFTHEFHILIMPSSL